MELRTSTGSGTITKLNEAMETEAEINLIPRIVPESFGGSPRRSANLWALARILVDIEGKGLHACFEMSKFGRDILTSGQACASQLCGTAACAAGFGYQLRIGLPRKSVGPPANYDTYLQYTCEHLHDYRTNAGMWMFHEYWSDNDNSAIGAARRISYFLCHPEKFPEDMLSFSEIHKWYRNSESHFNRWASQFQWDVTTEIADAYPAARKNLDRWIEYAIQNGRLPERLLPAEKIQQSESNASSQE